LALGRIVFLNFFKKNSTIQTPLSQLIDIVMFKFLIFSDYI